MSHVSYFKMVRLSFENSKTEGQLPIHLFILGTSFSTNMSSVRRGSQHGGILQTSLKKHWQTRQFNRGGAVVHWNLNRPRWGCGRKWANKYEGMSMFLRCTDKTYFLAFYTKLGILSPPSYIWQHSGKQQINVWTTMLPRCRPRQKVCDNYTTPPRKLHKAAAKLVTNC
jgi:hypothetical protein